MSESGTPARPRQLTMAGGFVIGGSVLLLLSIFDTMARLQSVEMRDEITKVITSSTGKGLGLSVSETLSAMRVGLMVAAACAAAAAVLGVYALQRQRAARLALGVLAVPILLTAPLTGGLLGAVVAAATLMLWSGPARDWYAGRPVREAGPSSGPGREQAPVPPPGLPGAGDRKGSAPPAAPPAASLTTIGSSTAPGTTAGFGQLPTALADPIASDWLPPPYAGSPSDLEVPVTVKVACILTWVFSGVVALLYAGMLLALIVAQDRIVEFVVTSPAWQRANLEQSALVPILWLGCLVFLAWAVGAGVLAWLTWRRHNWARWLLAASAASTIVAALFAFPVGILHQLAAVLTIVGLFGTAARGWFAPQPWVPGPEGGPSQAGPTPDYPSSDPDPRHDQASRPGGKPPVW